MPVRGTEREKGASFMGCYQRNVRKNMMDSEMPESMQQTSVSKLINQAPECVVLVDASNRIEAANTAASSLFGAAADILTSSDLVSWFEQDDAEKIRQSLALTLAEPPGSRLEEVVTTFARPPLRRVRLSIARLKHRSGLCVVVNTISAPSRATPSMPSVEDAAALSTPTTDTMMGDDSISQERTASQKFSAIRFGGSQKQDHVAVQSSRLVPDDVTGLAPQNFSEAGRVSSEKGDDQSGKTVFDKKVQRSNTLTHSYQAGVVGHRDIYAEFETVRDRDERQSAVPDADPVFCLRKAIEDNRSFAIAESVTLSLDIDDGVEATPLDEEMLTLIFSKLTERLVAVSPTYCDASIALKRDGLAGFRASFADIGRGLSEAELDMMTRQPELTMGISHNALAEVKALAGKLGLHMEVSSSVEAGTLVDIVHTA